MFKFKLDKNWQKNLTTALTPKGSDRLKKEPTPYRDWRFVVIGFFVTLVGVIGFSIYMSVKIAQDEFFVATNIEIKGVTFNTEGLHAVLNEFAKKEATFKKLETEGLQIADPAL